MSKLLSDNTIKIELGLKAQKQLKNHALQIQKKQQQQMKEKLQKQQEKSLKVKQIQNKFIRWVQTKNHDTQIRFEKVQKNKEDHLAKIIKKCKDRDKFLTKKQQDFNISKKKNLNNAWKKAQQFNNSIQNYYQSKQLMRKSIRHDNHTHSLHQKSPPVIDIDIQKQKQKALLQKQPIKISSNSVIINTNKSYSPLNINSTYYGNLKQSFIPDKQPKQKQGRLQRIQSANVQDTAKMRNQQILDKLKEINKKLQAERVQQMGQKMAKIQLSRQRRQKNHQKPLKTNDGQREGNVDYKQKKKKAQSHNKDNRMYSQQSYKPSSRVKDRTTDVRIRRQQQFEQNILDGYDYLQNIKIRHLKTVIAKNISYNAIQKKLYIERLQN